MLKRVFVTGLGPVSSIGLGKDVFWKNVKEGKVYFSSVDFPDIDIEQYKSRICSPIEDFSPADYIEKSRKLRRAARATQFTIVGTYLALKDAGFALQPMLEDNAEGSSLYSTAEIDPLRCGVIIGQSMDNADIMLPSHVRFLQYRGPKKMNPITLPQSNSNVGASTAAEWFSFKGTNLTIATACSSATHAIGMAALNIQHGIDDVIVAGGADAPIVSYHFSGFDLLNALSRRNDEPMRASRPFDKDRDGFVLGEGAGILILEEFEHARKRNAKIYGELIGCGFTADAYNILAPDPYGKAAINAIHKALAMAKVSPEEIEYINAHGTSTVINDSNESYIIKQVFGDYAYKIPISSSKSYFGHTLGAAGGLESIITLLTLKEGVIPPTSNLDNPDLEYVDVTAPELDKRCDLDYVSEGKRNRGVNIALKQSFGFGGQNGVLIFRKFQD